MERSTSSLNDLDAAARPLASGAVALRVALYAARIPWIGWVARHHWLVIDRSSNRDRWEIWQRSNAGGTAWGHLHRNLLPPEHGVGAGPGWLVAAWDGPTAAALARRIEDSPRQYPYSRYYRYWPGPNSNTYVQWVLGGRLRLLRAPGARFVAAAAPASARQRTGPDDDRPGR